MNNFTIVLPHPSLVTCQRASNIHAGDHPRIYMGSTLTHCLNPKPAEVRIEVGPCETCDGTGCAAKTASDHTFGTPPGGICKCCLTCHGSGDNEGRAKLRAVLYAVGFETVIDDVFAAIASLT